MNWSHWFAGMMDTRPSDRMYNCLPMYHSVGGVVATGAVLVNGGSVVIREKFSARAVLGRRRALGLHAVPIYRRAVPLSGATAPPHPRERAHRLRLCCGNGLRPDVWDEFKERFRHSAESWSSTRRPKATSRSTTSRASRARSAASRRSSRTARRLALVQVRCRARRADPRRGRLLHPLRAGRGRARRSARSSRRGEPRQPLRGLYRARRESEKKILRNVFEQGDAWFRTGDLMRKDEQRLSSISSTASATRSAGKARTSRPPKSRRRSRRFPGVVEANVYGVAIPGTDGRAGMAAIVSDDSDSISRHCAPSGRAACPTTRGRCSSAFAARSSDRHVQAQESATSRARASIRRDRPTRSISTTRERQAFVRLDHGAVAIASEAGEFAARPAYAVLPASTVSTVPVMFFGLVAEQEFDRVGDVVDLRQAAAARCAARPARAARSPRPCVMSVSMKPGRDRVDVDAQRARPRAPATVKPIMRRLGRAIDRQAAVAGEADDRGDVDDAAAAVGHHRAHDVFGQHDRATSVLTRTSCSICELCMMASAPSVPSAALLTRP